MTVIEKIQVIRTAPDGLRLVVVKVFTSEPGLYGVGCASFAHRDATVARAIEELESLAIGWDVARIEDFYSAATMHSYWRNGPVLNAAVSAVDMALWDILGKTAGLPLYRLLGGKTRAGAAIYQHAVGNSAEEIADDVLRIRGQGVRYVRMPIIEGRPSGMNDTHVAKGAPTGYTVDPKAVIANTISTLETVRSRVGDAVQLLVDVHERLEPADAVQLADAVRPFDLFFLEDPLPPEQLDWFARLRAHSTTPLAMGELFCHPMEWLPLVKNQLIDFARAHISAIGGITPARRLAAFCEMHGVRTAWHGPLDVSPIGHAANLHLDVSIPNFGIQEFAAFGDAARDVFPGMPEIVDGYAYLSDAPGMGVDIDAHAAAKFPPESAKPRWPVFRRPDGSVNRP